MKENLDFKLKLIYGITKKYAKYMKQNNIKTSICYYKEVYNKNLEVKQAQIFQKQLVRIKKSQETWNYTDISIVKNCIVKSMHHQTLCMLIKKWCQTLQKQLLQPFLEIQSNNSPEFNLTKHQKINKIRVQIKIFSSYLFLCGFQIYRVFFLNYYKHKSKIDNIDYTKQQIYQKQRVVFQCIVKNSLTGVKYFNMIYHQYFITIFGPIYYMPNSQISESQLKFQKFLKDNLKIQENQIYFKIYQNTSQSIWLFHMQSDIEKKIQRGCQIIKSIDEDHNRYYQRFNKPQLKIDEAITSILLAHLFLVYCPQISSSINYIKITIQYQKNFDNERINKEFYKDVQDFCCSWLDEQKSPIFSLILDGYDVFVSMFKH